MTPNRLRIGLILVTVLAFAIAFAFNRRDPGPATERAPATASKASATPPLSADPISKMEAASAVSVTERAPSEMTPLDYLAIGNPPTQANVFKMIAAVLGADDPWKVRGAIAALLLEEPPGELLGDGDDEDAGVAPLDELDANAALLVMGQALSILNQSSTTPEDRISARDLAERLLIGMWSIGSDRQGNIANILAALEELPPNALSHLHPIFELEAAPDALIGLVRAWQDRFGGEGVQAMLGLVDHPDLRLGCLAIGFLMRFDPDQYLPMVTDKFQSETPGTRAPLINAVARGLPGGRAIAVLTALGKDLEKTSMGDAAHLWNVLGGIMRESDDTSVLEYLRSNPDAGAREQMLLGIGDTRPQLLEGMLADPEFSNARGRLLISLSHQAQTPRLAEQTRETLHANDHQRGNALVAASVLCQLATEAPWLGPLKAELASIGRDDNAEAPHRVSAIRALRKTMSDAEFQGWLAQTELPEGVRAELARR